MLVKLPVTAENKQDYVQVMFRERRTLITQTPIVTEQSYYRHQTTGK